MLSESEFRNWVAFYELEPWGSDIEFYRPGIVASMVANTAMNRKPGGKNITPMDFMPVRKTATKAGGSKQLRTELFNLFDGVKKKP